MDGESNFLKENNAKHMSTEIVNKTSNGLQKKSNNVQNVFFLFLH